MTYKEAVEAKNKLGYTKYEKVDLEYFVFVTPNKNEDFTKYMVNVSGKLRTDAIAKIYCTNNDYTIKGIYYNIKGFTTWDDIIL